ncbi:response regulator [Sphingomicrobium sp. B8]|uniref:Response regulator n=1 Tax=Sphingomicrobium clamense TaxID=2851013 RepID=A0ABS6V3C1_9SPHN|nr:response regulator [Sphingomicrobium sp. B8]
MVVEDNALNIKLFCDLLDAHGHETRPVIDSREAIDTARAFDPDLVVTDIQLPHIDGMELMRLIRDEEPPLCRIPIMAVTAYAGEGDDERIRKAGAQAYVSKPISVIRFVEAVEKLLAEGPIPERCEGEADSVPVHDAHVGQDESGPENGAASQDNQQEEADPGPDQPPLI